MRRPLVFGVLAPIVASLTFSLLVLAFTVLSAPSDGARALGQWVHVVAGSLSLGRALFYVPAFLLGLLAMLAQRKAALAEGRATRWMGWTAAVIFMGAPEGALGVLVLPNGFAAVLAGLFSGALGLGLASALAPAADAGRNEVRTLAPMNVSARSQFGQRGL